MKLLFFVGFFLSLTTFVNSRVWHPGQNSPPQYETPIHVIEDYEEEYLEHEPNVRHHPFAPFLPHPFRNTNKRNENLKMLAEGVNEWLLHKTEKLFEPQPAKRRMPKSSNNYYFNIVQNFFFGKPINQVTPVNIIGKCRKNKDCKKSGHYCNKGVCTLKPQHSHDCKTDYDCKLKLPNHFLNLLPVFCEKGHCKIGHRKPFSPVRPTLPVPVTPEIENESTLPPLTTKKPQHCKKDSDCENHGFLYPNFIHRYCGNNGVCRLGLRPTAVTTTTKKPKQCKRDIDCSHRGRYKIKLPNRYCDNGICKKRPVTATTPKTTTTQSTTVTEVIVPQTKPSHRRHCQKDGDCVHYGRRPFFHHQFCDNGICKHGIRPTIATTEQTPTTEVTVPQTPAYPQQCQKDSDCLNQIEFQHKSLVAVYCNKGYCKLNKSPEINEATTTLPSPITDSTAVTKDKYYCESDTDCRQFFTFGWTSYCQNHGCKVAPENFRKVTPEITMEQTSVKPLLTTESDEYLPPTCDKDDDCLLALVFVPGPTTPYPINHRPVFCDSGKCRLGHRPVTGGTTKIQPSEVATTETSVEAEASPSIMPGILITFKPVENRLTDN